MIRKFAVAVHCRTEHHKLCECSDSFWVFPSIAFILLCKCNSASDWICYFWSDWCYMSFIADDSIPGLHLWKSSFR